jgi:hypothetical protein
MLPPPPSIIPAIFVSGIFSLDPVIETGFIQEHIAIC